jgi:polar amino acid transport system permease protein
MTDERNPLLPAVDAAQAGLGAATSKSKFDRWWFLVAGVIALILFLVISQPDPYRRVLIFVQDGLRVTLLVTITSFFLVLVLGLISGLGRLSKNPIISGIASVYVEIVRGIPLLVHYSTNWDNL